ncbi:hypothetical protein TNCV_3580031 [Trichonephila clavipes]|nr:hypothetical protein TNCV_3580031 [Trichonephila clavipes]
MGWRLASRAICPKISPKAATPPALHRPTNRHHATQQNGKHHFCHAQKMSTISLKLKIAFICKSKSTPFFKKPQTYAVLQLQLFSSCKKNCSMKTRCLFAAKSTELACRLVIKEKINSPTAGRLERERPYGLLDRMSPLP